MGERAAGFCRRHPLFCAALVAAASVVAADRGVVAGAAAVALFAAAAWYGGSWRRALGWLVCGGAAVAVFSVRESGRSRAAESLNGLTSRTVVARVVVAPRGNEAFWSAIAELENGRHAGARIAWSSEGPVPLKGSVLKARGTFERLPEPRNPGEFDEARWLRRQGVASMFRASRHGTEIASSWQVRLSAKVRAAFRKGLTAGLPDDSREALIIRAIVLGEHPSDGGLLAEPFRLSGTLHVFCVSGLHVAMVGGMGWLALSFAGVSRHRALAGLVLLVFGYAWLTGNGAPAVRASWMMTAFLGAFLLRRKPDLLNALGAVLLGAMFWDGRLLFQPGVQLSYGVVVCIAVGVSWTSRFFSGLAKPELYLPESLMTPWQRGWLRFRRWLAGGFATSSAAWIGSTPLTAWHFGLVTPVSVPATVTLLPVVWLVLSAALVSSVVHPIVPPAARALNRLNGKLAAACAGIADFYASLPGAHVSLRRSREPFLLIHDLPRGAGSALFATGEGNGMLIDCGDRQSFRKSVLPSVKHFGVAVDSIALTHPDAKHLGGREPVWDELPLTQALFPVESALSPTHREWLSQAPVAGVRTVQANRVREVPLGGDARLEVLLAPGASTQHSIADDRVAVYRLHWRGWRILFLSDAGTATEMDLLESGCDLAADVIVCGRHKCDPGMDDDFLRAVSPRVIIASNPAFPPEARPRPAELKRWRSLGIDVLDQAETGGVTLRIDGGGALGLEGFADRSKRRLKR